MDPRPASPGAARRAPAVAILAILALLFSLTPLADRLDLSLLDLEWRLVRKFAMRPSGDEVLVVAVDDDSLRRVREPPGLWHEPLGKALARIAAARPRAIGLELVLPERSYEDVRPGLDRSLLLGLAAARESGPFVATLGIDPRTRGAKRIHDPYLALLQEERLGLGLLARDADGAARRFSLTIPTEDGSFPTFVGRLCTALKRSCADGLLDYALGAPVPVVPFHLVLDAPDLRTLERIFRDRIVLVGETSAQSTRLPVPASMLAGATGTEMPAIGVHAVALRTALGGKAPREASRPWAVLLAAIAALVVLVRDWRIAAAAAVVLGAVLLAAGAWALRGGLALPLGAPLALLPVAWLATALMGFRSRYEIRRRRPAA